jgi:hypothetical protein
VAIVGLFGKAGCSPCFQTVIVELVEESAFDLHLTHSLRGYFLSFWSFTLGSPAPLYFSLWEIE